MNEEIKPKLRVWIVLDAKAGHCSHSIGLLECLRLSFEVDALLIRYRPWTRPMGRILQKFWPRCLFASEWGMLKQEDSSVRRPDLVIGSGGGIQWAVAALAKKYSAYSIFLGSPRSMPVDSYNLVLHHFRDLEKLGVCMIPMMPVPITVSSIKLAASEYTKVRGEVHGRVGCCLIGGNGAGCIWSHKDGENLAELLNRMSDESGIRWVVTTSRRTPSSMEKALKSNLQPKYVVDSCWAGEGDQRRIVSAYLGLAERILVSIDSVSMMNEALATTKPVSVFYTSRHKINARHEDFLGLAEENNWITRISLDEVPDSSLFLNHQNRFRGDLLKVISSIVAPKILARNYTI